MVNREETSAHFTLSGLQRVPQIAGFSNARVDTPKPRAFGDVEGTGITKQRHQDIWIPKVHVATGE